MCVFLIFGCFIDDEDAGSEKGVGDVGSGVNANEMAKEEGSNIGKSCVIILCK